MVRTQWAADQEDLLLNLVELGTQKKLNLVDPFDPYYYSEDDIEPTRIDPIGRQIVLSSHVEGADKKHQLIHHMAHAATCTITDRDVRWHAEMRRLRRLGAPVGNKYLELSLRSGEYAG